MPQKTDKPISFPSEPLPRVVFLEKQRGLLTHLLNTDFIFIVYCLFLLQRKLTHFSVCSLVCSNREAGCLTHCSGRFCRVCGAVREEVALLLLLRLPTSVFGPHCGVRHVRPLLCLLLKGGMATTLGNQSQLKPLGTLSAICEYESLLRDPPPCRTFSAQETLHGRIKGWLGFTSAQ